MNRRILVLADLIQRQIAENSTVLDIGAGSGEIAKEVLKIRPDLKITGIDIKKRSDAAIEINSFNGKDIEYDNDSFDYAIIIDVLHHTYEKKQLLSEAKRVSRKGVVIKDHVFRNKLEYIILSFMDYFGNRPYKVKVIYDYFSLKQWKELFKDVKVNIKNIKTKLHLYPFPFSLIFDGQLHLLVVLTK